MSIEKNIRTVKEFFAAIGRGDRAALRTLAAEDIEWIIPGKDWPLAGIHLGHRYNGCSVRRLPNPIPAPTCSNHRMNPLFMTD